MTQEERAALRVLATSYPAGEHLPVPCGWLLELLSDGEAALPDSAALPPADFTAAELGTRLGRNPSTVRGWLEAGRIPEAYLDSSRRWRVPVTAVLAFERREREGKSAVPTHRGRSVRLDSWRSAS